MHEKDLREQVFGQLPVNLAQDGRLLVQELGRLESDIWELARLIDSELNSKESRSLVQLSNWVEAAQALASRNAVLLRRGESLVEACRDQSLPAALVIEVRDRIAPFLEDIALAQEHFRSAAQRAADGQFRS